MFRAKNCSIETSAKHEVNWKHENMSRTNRPKHVVYAMRAALIQQNETLIQTIQTIQTIRQDAAAYQNKALKRPILNGMMLLLTRWKKR